MFNLHEQLYLSELRDPAIDWSSGLLEYVVIY